MAEITTKPWDGSPGRFTDSEYKRSALIDSGEGNTPKARYKLPVREPDGTLNKNGIMSAYSVLRGGMGGVTLNPQKKAEALNKLRTMAASVGIKLGGKGTGAPGANAPANGPPKSGKTSDGGKIPPQFLSKQKTGGESKDMSRFDTDQGDGYVGIPYEGDFQLPYDFSAPTKEANGLWRKQILPKGSILHNGEVLNFTDDVLQAVKDNHHARAFDHTPVTLVSHDNQHGNSPEDIRGEIQDYDLTDDGLDAIVKLDAKGEEMISSNPGAHGISARFKSDFTRKDDGRYFGPVIAHGAITSEPYISGLRPWENFKDFSDARAEDEFLDLSEEYWYESPDPEAEMEDFTGESGEEETEEEGDGSGDVDDEEDDEPEESDLDPEDQALVDELVADLSQTYGAPEPEPGTQTTTRREEGMGRARTSGSDTHDMAYQRLEADSQQKDARIAQLEEDSRNDKIMARMKDFSANGGPKWARDYFEPLMKHAMETEGVSWKDFSSGKDRRADVMDLVEGLMESIEGNVDFSERGDVNADFSSEGETQIKQAEKIMEDEKISFTEAARKIGMTT